MGSFERETVIIEDQFFTALVGGREEGGGG